MRYISRMSQDSWTTAYYDWLSRLDNSWLYNYRACFWDNYWLRFDNDWLWFCWLNHRFWCWLDNWFDSDRCRFLNYWFGHRCRFGYRSWLDNRLDRSRLLIERFWLLNYWLGQRCWFYHSWCWFLSDRSWLNHDWFWFWFRFFDNNGCWFDNRLNNSRLRFLNCFNNLRSRLGSRYNLDLFFFFTSSRTTTFVCIISLFTRLFLWHRGTWSFILVFIFFFVSASTTTTFAS